jgi:hypothetical protein
MTYLSATFKQAIADGSVAHGEFEVLDTDGGKRPCDGWMTAHFASEDNQVTHYDQKRTRSHRGFAITHLETGYAVMSFEAHHITLNFMLELERLFANADVLSDDVKKQLSQYLKTRGRHVSQTYIPVKRGAA